ncbi:hypothetical protein BL250_16475 [Erwinia sp. OLTSP20]|nr:hypothetical protein BK416_03755 [Erwinia sp. OLSSP12]PIJ79616.1 hypothetical protein BLD47_13175 [Erwinia sp. OLCASP19]PIJ80401.1 hypothetical protein BLD46_15020 [Erwinia sp. OLMTSP26]PIJ82516.1 hypothetical protein BLD49_14915 [Erwinia sp. OLMDSP33]PIJ88817.1 hypothetical protein BL250_16475 [Erwinia sp. OLTSP20]PIJ91507.1 hypothetical protein BL249_09190 [Erwinia sp. OLFS4]
MFLGILYFPSRVPIVKPMHTLISINMSELFEISGINILYIKPVLFSSAYSFIFDHVDKNQLVVCFSSNVLAKQRKTSYVTGSGLNGREWVPGNASAKHGGGGDFSPPVALTGWTHKT